MGAEKKFSRFLVEKLRIAGWWVQPIESSETAVGIPDLYLCKDGVSLWMELKALDKPWPNKQRLPFRPGQYGWLHTHGTHGGLSVVGIKMSNGFVFARIDNIDREGLCVSATSPVCFMLLLNPALLERWIFALARRAE
jgi:hypothetical protein